MNKCIGCEQEFYLSTEKFHEGSQLCHECWLQETRDDELGDE